MPTNIPDGITRDHIIEAIRQHSGGVDHRFADSTGYDLLFEGNRFDFATQYPSRLGEGFIEVHHLSPLSTQDEPRKTTLDDLLVVCANCHRMIHRTKDADGNLAELREHFGERPDGSDSG